MGPRLEYVADLAWPKARVVPVIAAAIAAMSINTVLIAI